MAKREVELNDEMEELLLKVHPSHRSTALNLGLKMLSDSPIFKSFFLMPEYRNSSTEDSGLSGTDLISSLDNADKHLSISTISPSAVEQQATTVTTEEKKPILWDTF